MKIKSLILSTGFIALAYLGFSQTVVITDDPAYTTGRASSVLDIKSTSKGLLIPRLTQSERNAISSPEIGLMIFQTDGTAGFYYYSSTGWTAVGGSSSGGIQSYTFASRPSSPAIGTAIWCSNCGTVGELQVFNAASVWTNAMGGASLPVLPTITTVTQSLVKSTTASSGGSSISAGGGTITSRGVCWNTTGNPTISDSRTSDGTGTTDFVSAITGLLPSTVYYVRAYAVNTAGTSYGNQISFTTDIYRVGHPAYGGVIAYHNAGSRELLIATITESSSTYVWGCSGTYPNAQEDYYLGAGMINSAAITGTCPASPVTGASACQDVYDGNYFDWYLPSSWELNLLIGAKASIGGFTSGSYWSSTESSSTNGYYRTSTNGSGITTKGSYYKVRAVRLHSY